MLATLAWIAGLATTARLDQDRVKPKKRETILPTIESRTEGWIGH
jgi:hypothetical protein